MKKERPSSPCAVGKAYTRHYTTEWADCDNIVIMIYDEGDPVHIACGIIEVSCFKTGKHKGEALIWNLEVRDVRRGKGYARMLLRDAIDVAEEHDCHTAVLEWDLRDSPQWVLQWYVREGFDEKEFSEGYALMKKPL